ncbi:probable disease resistance protein At4g27220 [Quercus lobata]|uniref:probable disease resistance protein At4g27220 n=1 Tax=Quercus lobata TaxID=97700 RepID=UPI001246EA25|nr:probable disease resistance protein At4g27220 [Quercus lobata]
MKIISHIIDTGGNLVVPIKKYFGYLSRYNSNIDNLRDQFQKLGDKRDRVQLKIGEAKQNEEAIALEVESWIEKVDNISQGLQIFLEQDVKANTMGLCPNLNTRYSLSRKAKKKALEIDGVLRDGQFAEVVETSSKNGFKVFESRIPIMKEVLTAFRDDKINMIGICGMEGIGKTTMAKEVAKRAKDDNLFDEVVMAVVSHKKDLSKIQGQIADMLGLELDRESVVGRAEQIYSRLMVSSKSVLVIFDDVWEEVNPKDVGIPYEGELNSCKILLTSRSEEVCNQMKSHKIVKIEVLTEEEAWNFFKEMVGNCVDTPDLHPIAEEVAKECKGIPIAIVTVGRALENNKKNKWVAALQHLKNPITKNIPGLDSIVQSSIEISYTFLESDEAKSCILLCCLFPEDYDIPIEYLVRYGVGQRLFAKIDTVAEARNRVHVMVKDLKRSNLLLDSNEEECVKMHYVVRDVGKSISNEHIFLEEWTEKDTYENYVAISLVSRELKNHPDDLECPKLELLQLSCGKYTTRQTLPTNLFKGMMGLKVLALQGMSFPSLPQSIQVLQNLRTMLLEYCEIEDVSAIGSLGKLEMLSFIGSEIKELPEEIGNLSHLKLLDLSKCSTLQQIPPGLLSNLTRLEELYMGKVFVNWEPTDGKGEGANASLAELTSFSHSLMALQIHIPNIRLLPKDLHFKNQMIKFRICACDKPMNWRYDHLSTFWDTTRYIFKNSLVLGRFAASEIAESRMLCQLLQKSEIIILKEIKDFKNILYELDKEGFPCLLVLSISDSEGVEYVIDATSHQTSRVAFPILQSLELMELHNLKEIYHGQFPEESFSGAHSQLACFHNLRSLRLLECNHLKNVFSLSIARGLVQLQQLHVVSCDDMKEIFCKEGEDGKALDRIMFPELRYINLSYVPRLIGFCTVEGPVDLVQPSLNQEVGRIDTDELATIRSEKMTDIQQITRSFPESTTPISHKFFSSKTILWQPNLQKLEVFALEGLEVIFDLEGQEVDHDGQRIVVLARLKTLTLQNLSKLMYVWKNVPQGIQGFQNLTSIEINACHNLRYLFPHTVAKLLVVLQSIEIRWCDMIENIVQRDGEEEAEDIILFPKLTSFHLGFLPNLMSFYIEPYSFEWSSMNQIYLSHCPKLKTCGSEIRSTRKLKKIIGELDLIPQEQGLECAPLGKNYGPMVVSEQGTTKKSEESSSMNKEGNLTKVKDPRANDIDNPSEMWCTFPSHLIESLKNLKTIELSSCDSLEVIFQLEELNFEESHVESVLDQLRKLNLYNLPNLMHIWKKGPEIIMGFKNLRLLEVSGCKSLTYLFSPSIAKLLVMLEEIRVTSCKKIEEILQRAREEKEEKEVLFHKVNSILLRDLPNLKCFCPETNAFEWPSLKEITVIGCPTLSMFIPSNLKTPKLEGVYDEVQVPSSPWDENKLRNCQWKGDLNATIQHMFKGKVWVIHTTSSL